MGANILAQRPAFAAFPRLEIPGIQDRERLRRLSGLIEERAQFEREIIAAV